MLGISAKEAGSKSRARVLALSSALRAADS
jgi:hypothetical protein